jgi:hypothetical protein
MVNEKIYKVDTVDTGNAKWSYNKNVNAKFKNKIMLFKQMVSMTIFNTFKHSCGKWFPLNSFAPVV